MVYWIDGQHLAYSVEEPFRGDIDFFHVVECLAHMPGVSFDKRRLDGEVVTLAFYDVNMFERFIEYGGFHSGALLPHPAHM